MSSSRNIDYQARRYAAASFEVRPPDARDRKKRQESLHKGEGSKMRQKKMSPNGRSVLQTVCSQTLNSFCQSKNGSDRVRCQRSKAICSGIIESLHETCLSELKPSSGSSSATKQPDSLDVCEAFYAGLVGIARSAGVAPKKHSARDLLPIWQPACQKSFDDFSVFGSDAGAMRASKPCGNVEATFVREAKKLLAPLSAHDASG
jgi:hypothetical protein